MARLRDSIGSVREGGLKSNICRILIVEDNVSSLEATITEMQRIYFHLSSARNASACRKNGSRFK